MMTFLFLSSLILWTGEISLVENEVKLQYAWAHMERLLSNIWTKRFENALRVISNHNRVK